MAGIVEKIVATLDGSKRLRGVPYVVIEEIVNLTMATLCNDVLPAPAAAAIEKLEQDLCWCDACGEGIERRSVVYGRDSEAWCTDCKKDFED